MHWFGPRRSFSLLQVAVFDFGTHRTSPVVLLVDRRDDPVTPLLTQWTYQARRPGALQWRRQAYSAFAPACAVFC
jgi:hypothetical protein